MKELDHIFKQYETVANENHILKIESRKNTVKISEMEQIISQLNNVIETTGYKLLEKDLKK